MEDSDPEEEIEDEQEEDAFYRRTFRRGTQQPSEGDGVRGGLSRNAHTNSTQPQQQRRHHPHLQRGGPSLREALMKDHREEQLLKSIHAATLQREQTKRQHLARRHLQLVEENEEARLLHESHHHHHHDHDERTMEHSNADSSEWVVASSLSYGKKLSCVHCGTLDSVRGQWCVSCGGRSFATL